MAYFENDTFGSSIVLMNYIFIRSKKKNKKNHTVDPTQPTQKDLIWLQITSFVGVCSNN